jgi:hypothetical protein
VILAAQREVETGAAGDHPAAFFLAQAAGLANSRSLLCEAQTLLMKIKGNAAPRT